MQKIISLIVAASLSSALYGGVLPSDNGSALAGIKSVNAVVSILVWNEDDVLSPDGYVKAPNREIYQGQMQLAFELGLRRDGVIVEQTAGYFLRCVMAQKYIGGVMTYTLDVELFRETYSNELTPMIWRSGYAGHLAVTRANASNEAQVCQEIFVNEWLRWNPK